MSVSKYGIVWEHKEELAISAMGLFTPSLVRDDTKSFSGEGVSHIFIEGENYHALVALRESLKGKVGVIFIDPPYNTGSREWCYYNDYVCTTDKYKHSKWLSFLEARLVLAKELLADTGIIVVAIDDTEIFELGMLMNTVFGEENRLGVVSVLHKAGGGNQSQFFGNCGEFLLFYAKDKAQARFNSAPINESVADRFTEVDSQGTFRWLPFLATARSKSRADKPNQWFPLYVSPDLTVVSEKYMIGWHEVWPVNSAGADMSWKNIKSTFIARNNKGFFKGVLVKGNVCIVHKFYAEQYFNNMWLDKRYNYTTYGSALLESIIGVNFFSYPKSINLLVDVLKLTSREDSVVLDFFGGSGTTGHAVTLLNTEDGGCRQFVVVQSDENNLDRPEGGIASTVCYPRLRNVLKGYCSYPSGGRVNGLGGGLDYLRVELLEKEEGANG